MPALAGTNTPSAKWPNCLKTEKFDAVVTSSPPHSTQLIGLELQKKYGLRWIADLRDPWTDIYYYKDLNHTLLARKLDEKYEKQVLLKADALTGNQLQHQTSFPQ
jgi:hypothetical protein